ncbi:MAG: hypothetical protein H0X25_12585 [Acidobacteriales bacterium]|nr:hypothetical protein [Terriglobales bacterium]
MRVKRSGAASYLLCAILAMLLASLAQAQTCSTASDMDEPTRNALTSAGKRYYDMIAKADAASLKQNAIAGLGGDTIDSAVKDNQAALSGTLGTARPPFLLKAASGGGEFLCGVFGASGQTADSAVFEIPGLSAGNYGIVLLDSTTSKSPYTVAFILQQMGTDWKLGGLYVHPNTLNGHDAKWFQDQAHQYQAKGQLHNAWFYYLEARDLLLPLKFMSTLATDRLYDEAQKATPPDLPSKSPLMLASGAKTYKVTDMFPIVVGDQFNLVIKYAVPDVANTGQAFQDNIAVMKALLAKYPELHDAFDGMVARAVAPSGQDYGTMMPIKSLK